MMKNSNLSLKFLQLQRVLPAIVLPIEQVIKEDFFLKNKEIFVKHQITVPVFKIPTSLFLEVMAYEIFERGDDLIAWLMEKWLLIQEKMKIFFDNYMKEGFSFCQSFIQKAAQEFGVINTWIYLVFKGCDTSQLMSLEKALSQEMDNFSFFSNMKEPESQACKENISKSEDEVFMAEALLEAQKAFDKEEVPVGAVLVLEGRIIVKAHNLVETMKDATMHAEMQCIKEGMRLLDNWRLLNCTLYTTLEPCSMCGGALIASRVKKVVYGACDIRQGSCGSWSKFMQERHPIHNVKVEGGVLANEASDLLKRFFKKQRERKKTNANHF